MDPTTNLNNTQNVSNTQNPQDTGVPADNAPGANNAEDFQSTAPSDALNQESAENLSVERTGEPITDAPAPVANESSMSGWLIGAIILGVIFVVWVIYRLLKEEVEVFTPEAPAKAEPAKAAPASKSKSASKPAKKTTRSGKKKTNSKKRSKKSGKRR